MIQYLKNFVILVLYPFHQSINPFLDFFNFLKILKILNKINPDYFLGYTIKPVIYGSLAAKLTGIPNIFSIITGLGYIFTERNSHSNFINSIVKILYKLSLNRNKIIFFQNQDDLKLFIDLKIVSPDKAIIINGSGVDTNYYFTNKFPQKISFLFIARLIKEKGIIEYGEAAKILKQKYPNIDFKVVGWFDNNPHAIPEKIFNKWIQNKIISYLGKFDDVRPAIENSSVFILPSYREGTPRSVLEAMSMQRPIITTDAPGCRETVIQGENGFLIPPKDISALVNAMEFFIKNPEVIPRMGKRSREIALEKYDVHKVNNRILTYMGLQNS